MAAAAAGAPALAPVGAAALTAPAAGGGGPVLRGTSLAVGVKYTGKVRDVYSTKRHLLLVTTDRQSAFDRVLAAVPYKGHVLNLTSAFWFDSTRDIVRNAVVAVPHPNVTIARKCTPFRIEFVVRAYLTGTTSTSIYQHYKAGSRLYCGHVLPEGMKKNEKLAEVLCTPTTKDDVHDRPISAREVVEEGWMSAADWDFTCAKALQLFQYGQRVAASHGLILVDTKYEFGKDDETGEITLIDEVHTPDSSRYWIAATYAERMAAGMEPENIDKEFLRLWFREHCDPYRDLTLPDAPPSLVAELSRRYIQLYESITGKSFDRTSVPATDAALAAEVAAAVAPWFPPAATRVTLLLQRADEAAAAPLIAGLTAMTRVGEATEATLPADASASAASARSSTPHLIATTPVALETHIVDPVAAPAHICELAAAIRKEAAAGLPTVIVVYAGTRVDHVSRIASAHSAAPVVVAVEAAAARGEPALPAATLASMFDGGEETAVAFCVGAAAAVGHVRRLVSVLAGAVRGGAAGAR